LQKHAIDVDRGEPRHTGGIITKHVRLRTQEPAEHHRRSDESVGGFAGSVADAPVVLPAADITVRHGRRDDPVAGLVYDAAPEAYRAVTGSERAARAALEQLWRTPGHSASFEHALVAELDRRVVGVLIGFPARDRYRLHLVLLRKGLRHVSIRRWPLLLAALPHLIAATPRPPRRAYYVATIAVARHARRRDVASTLGHHAELAAQRHRVARRALERYGLTPSKDRRWGYVLYAKSVGRAASTPRES
jgi:GNAT superfamily N-acetyltransferase